MTNTRINGINEVDMVTIGGIEQYISIKGNNKDRPLILFLHGGPGTPLSYVRSYFPSQLEDSFVVVHWDQRGAGHSFSENIPSDSMNINQFVSDTIELTDYLLNKYEREKIYILGVSWGSMIGIRAVHQRPEKFFAYIGTGQMIDIKAGDKVAYEYLLEEVRRQEIQEALRELENIGSPPHKSMEDLIIFVKWLRELGIVEKKVDIFQLYSKNCSSDELEKILKGASFSKNNLLEEMSRFNVDGIKEIKAPVYFIQGEKDFQTPSILVEKFCDQLISPKKEFISFEGLSHTAVLEEPDRFIDILAQVLEQTHK